MLQQDVKVFRIKLPSSVFFNNSRRILTEEEFKVGTQKERKTSQFPMK
jgi:hypothetical protein